MNGLEEGQAGNESLIIKAPFSNTARRITGRA